MEVGAYGRDRRTGRAVEDVANPAVVSTTCHVPGFSGARTAHYQLVVAFALDHRAVTQLQISAANHYNTKRRRKL